MHNHRGISTRVIVHLPTSGRLLLADRLFIVFLDFLELGIDNFLATLC